MPRRRDKLQDARSAQIARDRAARRRSRKERRRALESVDLSVPRRKSRLETFKAQCSFRDWDHPERSTSQLDQLLETLGRRAPKLLIDQYRQPIWRLARTEWIRPLEEWKPKGKSRSSIFRSLVRHLVELYPTPQFLLSLFHDLFNARGPTEALYVHLAQGGSLKKALATNLLRTSMTKRMCHDFLQSPANMGVIEAVRRAQVRSFGGTRRIADAIVGLRMGENLTADESFWLSVVQWTCNQPMLDPNEVGPIFDWVGSRLCEDPDFSMKGRTGTSVLRAVDEWHAELAKVDRIKVRGKFLPSGYSNGEWEIKRRGQVETWSCEEILDTGKLLAEGRAMRHCVYSYSRSIADGRVSIWSLRCGESRQLTIEVCNRDRRIVQARGRCNKSPTGIQARELRRWATMNDLTVARYVLA